MVLGRQLGRVINFLRRKSIPHDETLAWIRFLNPGMLDQGNVWQFDRAIKEMPPKGAVVEIGSFCGLSLNHITHLMEKHSRRNPVFSVDAWNFEGFSLSEKVFAGTHIESGPYRELVMETFTRNLLLFSGTRLPHHIRLDSDHFFDAWQNGRELPDHFGRSVRLGGPIAFAYIDGDHSYEQSWRDFENIDRHLVPGGFIVFDDSADWTDWGSHHAAKKAARLPNYELIGRTPNYCIRKIR